MIGRLLTSPYSLFLWSDASLRSAIAIVAAYLLGSIPFGYLIVRSTQGADVRETGSGGTGATNVSRRAGKLAGVVTLLLDALKGAAAIAVAKLVLGFPIFGAGGQIGSPLSESGEKVLGSHAVLGHMTSAEPDLYWWVAAAAIAVIVGHIFPIWLRFRGGKGVATGVGVFLILAPATVALSAVVFVVAVVLTRYVSLGSILAVLSIPLIIVCQNNFIRPIADFAPLFAAAVAAASLIVFAHRQNIRRLVSGTENKFK